MKRLYYAIEARKWNDACTNVLCYSDGVIRIEGGKFQGYLTNDYFEGTISEKEIDIRIYISLENRVCHYQSYFEFVMIEPHSQYYIFNVESDELLELIFVEKINSDYETEINRNIESVKKQFNIS